MRFFEISLLKLVSCSEQVSSNDRDPCIHNAACLDALNSDLCTPRLAACTRYVDEANLIIVVRIGVGVGVERSTRLVTFLLAF